jgi:hypothetical protein
VAIAGRTCRNGGGAKGRRHLAGMGDQPGDREESSMTCKSYDIPKTLIWEAWLRVKDNQTQLPECRN